MFQLNLKLFIFIYCYGISIVKTTSSLSSIITTTTSINQLNLTNFYENNSILNDIEYLKNVNYMIGISKIAETYNTTTTTTTALTQCRYELIEFLNAITRRDIWALKLIDSFGNTPNSFHGGNHFWFSSRDLCEDLNNPYKITINHKYSRILHRNFFNSTSPYPVYYRMIYYNFTSPMYLDMKVDIKPYIHVGLCIPRSCDENEILTYTNNYFQNQTFEIQKLFDIKMNYLQTKVPEFNWSYFLTNGALLFGVCIAFTLIMTILAKIYTNYEKLNSININNYEFIKCWSFKNNLNDMIKTDDDTTNYIAVIPGIKTLVCMWIIILHCSSLSLFVMNNTTIVFAKMESIMYQMILQAIYYVDVFFIISAFLLSYNFLSNTKRLATIKSNSFEKNLKLFIKMIIHRYLRLMPILFIITIISECVYDYLNMMTPFYMQKNLGIYCKETWWYNIFFINNFLDLKDICVSWSWYLSCEFQYFIFFTFILFIYAKNELCGKSIFILCTIIFVTISFLMHYYYEYTFQIDVIYQTMKMLYVNPLARISPYFGGILIGWLYYKTKSIKLNINNYLIIIFWLITIIYFLWTINMTYLRLTPIWIVSILMSYGKLLFGIIISLTIYISLNGYGGIYNYIMSNKIFLYLNKLTYCAYMLNPIFIALLFALKGDSTPLSDADKILDCLAIILLAFIGSFILVLLWELPFYKLSRKLIKY